MPLLSGDTVIEDFVNGEYLPPVHKECLTPMEWRNAVQRGGKIIIIRNIMLAKEIVVDASMDYSLDWGICPGCHGIFGIDATYIDQVNENVKCPMCGWPVTFSFEGE